MLKFGVCLDLMTRYIGDCIYPTLVLVLFTLETSDVQCSSGTSVRFRAIAHFPPVEYTIYPFLSELITYQLSHLRASVTCFSDSNARRAGYVIMDVWHSCCSFREIAVFKSSMGCYTVIDYKI